MNKLPENFEMDRYGLHVRLVNEEDAEFILSLRTDPKLSRYIHPTDNDLEKQKDWIRKYKKREKEGQDYYFIYYHNNNPIGLNRIYDIKQSVATGGSWVCKRGINPEHSIATLLIMREIMFDLLGKDKDVYDVRKGNKQVQKLHLMFGAKIVSENDIDYFFELDKEIYYKNRSKIIKLLNIK